jgi:ElaB/YqjD/DUF883 family membrane-anchored ribosome-binding protein
MGRMCHGLGSLAIKAEKARWNKPRPWRVFAPSHRWRKAMAERSDATYESALDDITRRGISAIRSTQNKVDSAISNTADAARGAVDSVEKVQDSVHGAILHSIKVRPYTTLAIAGLIGFAYGALRR